MAEKRRLAASFVQDATKELVESKGLGDNYIHYVKKNEPKRVRFLTGSPGWLRYYQYFDPVSNMPIPMLEGEVAPEGIRVQERVLTAAVDIATDEVITLQLAKSLASKMAEFESFYGSVTDRDYQLVRRGDGLNTEYSAQAFDKDSNIMVLEKYKVPDLEAALFAALDYALGKRAEKSGEDPQPFVPSEQPAQQQLPETKLGQPVPKPEDTEPPFDPPVKPVKEPVDVADLPVEQPPAQDDNAALVELRGLLASQPGALEEMEDDDLAELCQRCNVVPLAKSKGAYLYVLKQAAER